jgi:hypothetical protein
LDLRPDLKMAAAQLECFCLLRWLECLCLLRWLVGGAVVGSDRGKPLAAGGGHDVDGAAGVLFLPEGDIEVYSLSLPNLPISGENLNTLGGGGAPASFPS